MRLNFPGNTIANAARTWSAFRKLPEDTPSSHAHAHLITFLVIASTVYHDARSFSTSSVFRRAAEVTCHPRVASSSLACVTFVMRSVSHFFELFLMNIWVLLSSCIDESTSNYCIGVTSQACMIFPPSLDAYPAWEKRRPWGWFCSLSLWTLQKDLVDNPTKLDSYRACYRTFEPMYLVVKGSVVWAYLTFLNHQHLN